MSAQKVPVGLSDAGSKQKNCIIRVFSTKKTRRQTLIDARAQESGRFRIPLLHGFIRISSKSMQQINRNT